MGDGGHGYLNRVEKSPEELTDDQLISRLREESETTRPGYLAEHYAPVELDQDIELDQDGVGGQNGVDG
jgi:hypothetical protein